MNDQGVTGGAGRGSMKERFCGRCGGRGTVVKQYDDYGISDPKDVPCPSCGGCGKVVPVTDAHALEQRARQAEAENDRLKAALEEREQSFALYDDACRRGTALWRSADPEHRQMVLPDTAALVAWLLERLGERELALGQIAADLKASWYGCTGPRAAGQDERLVAERLAAYENALAIVDTARAALAPGQPEGER